MSNFNLTKTKAKKILKKWRTDKALFNWCEEYKSFVDECVGFCVSYEWDYMLKRSFEDSESPVSYDDVDFNDYDQLRENIIYEIEQTYDLKNKQEVKNLKEEINLIKCNGGYLNIESNEDVLKWVEDLDDNEARTLGEELFNIYDIPQSEVYEWWLISDPLKYRLEQLGEIFLNGAWGRCTTGQSISLDYNARLAFIDLIKSWYKLNDKGEESTEE